jgi:hypothetical protein
VKDCGVETIDDFDKSGKFGFAIRFVQMTRMIERTFHTETADDRDDWIKAIQEVRVVWLNCTAITGPKVYPAPAESPARPGQTPLGRGSHRQRWRVPGLPGHVLHQRTSRGH